MNKDNLVNKLNILTKNLSNSKTVSGEELLCILNSFIQENITVYEENLCIDILKMTFDSILEAYSNGNIKGIESLIKIIHKNLDFDSLNIKPKMIELKVLNGININLLAEYGFFNRQINNKNELLKKIYISLLLSDLKDTILDEVAENEEFYFTKDKFGKTVYVKPCKRLVLACGTILSSNNFEIKNCIYDSLLMESKDMFFDYNEAYGK
ncbi:MULTISPECIES: hypothetical protein [unclassified Fusobacterium]|uniref:hypothetical protein n=1 Tax=unclassified Fusobacterium TaxID=2648384 RepID=UPI001B8B084B|nr:MULTISPECIES: hypothetical protein [unclassified Fusobacterium]MBR8700487.1 hypothetical protein [Fusobacterium sp. DD45]MBR8710248.1 hypothetical protein [Fusobacterium sp. DD28]MBR8750770.1 hypothetical protein [Fusobacterium sp. DD26]